jgi:hypothetical protein
MKRKPLWTLHIRQLQIIIIDKTWHLCIAYLCHTVWSKILRCSLGKDVHVTSKDDRCQNMN